MSPPPPRIISLLPSTTEILSAIGAGSHIVGTTHECDYPSSVLTLPNCTSSLLAPGLSASEIDAAVTASLADDGVRAIYKLHDDKVRALAPTVIVTQSLCAVCAVPQTKVDALACTLPHACKVVPSDPHDIEELMENIVCIGKAIGYEKEAEALVVDLRKRLSKLEEIVSNLLLQPLPSSVNGYEHNDDSNECNGNGHGKTSTETNGSISMINTTETNGNNINNNNNNKKYKKPSIVILEWPDPPYAPGHWVPQQIAYAGGTCLLGSIGTPSTRVPWDHLSQLSDAVDVVVAAFCGYDLAENQKQVDLMFESGHEQWARFCKGKSVYATDASAYFSRPGNRLVDGAELLCHILYDVEEYRPKRKGMASRRVVVEEEENDDVEKMKEEKQGEKTEWIDLAR